MTTSLITTAIPYVNARPHLGFAYELVLADLLARHRRRRGRDVRLLTGTDDNSLKNVTAAAREGVPPHALVARNTEAFRALGPLLDAAPDDFVQTSIDPRHRAAVCALWRACAARGDLYRRAWTGRYCAGCEAFVDDSVALCPEHGTAPEPVSEDNWFFRLSRWREPIRDAIASGQLAIASDAARGETLAFLDGEVRDLSVSRAASRAPGWGIPVPGDPSQVVYVWFDALAYYLSALGYGSDRDEQLAHYWTGGGERAHVIGKGISRFHAVYWPAFLLSAGLPLPDRVLVHGYLTVDGEKISKSRLPVEVGPIVERFGADALRWYFARRCRTRSDGDVDRAAIAASHDRDLADGLGNLVQRSTALADRLGVDRIQLPTVESPAAAALRAQAEALPERIDAALDRFLPDEAAAAVVELLDAANRVIALAAPWRLAASDPAAAAAALHAPLAAARSAAAELVPFVPATAHGVLARLGEPGASRWGEPVAVRRGPPPVPRKLPRLRRS